MKCIHLTCKLVFLKCALISHRLLFPLSTALIIFGVFGHEHGEEEACVLAWDVVGGGHGVAGVGGVHYGDPAKMIVKRKHGVCVKK